MKNEVELESVDQEAEECPDLDRLALLSEQGHAGAQHAILAQLKYSKEREARARRELQRLRDDSATAAKAHRDVLADAEKRSMLHQEIQLVEQDHLQRTIRALEEAATREQAAAKSREEEYHSLNSALLLKVSDLESTREHLQTAAVRLESDLSAVKRTMARKEFYGRDKARRLDNALDALAQERLLRKRIQQSSSMRIGRLVTTSLKNPWTAIALIWRLPKMILVEATNNNGGTSE